MKKSITVFLFFIIGLCGYAQIPYFQNYTLLKKNETVQVNVIFQDNAGFIWYGTNKGLFKFDGINQKRFTLRDSLADENITALAEDSVHRLWIGYKNGSLSYIENDVIKKFEPKEGTSTQPISDILFDTQGAMWFSTYNDGLYYFINDRLYRLDEQEGMPDLFIYDILEDRSGNIWAGTDGGAVVLSRVATKVTIRVIDDHNGLPDNIVKKLALSENGSIWMATEDAGIVNYDLQSGNHKTLIDGQWNFGSITDFVIKGNSFWISSLRKGLIVFDKSAGHTKLYDAKAGDGLTAINSLYKDYEGNIWAGTKTGVMRTAGDNLEFIEMLGSMQHENVLALAVDQHDNIWYSTSEGLFKRTLDAKGTPTITRQLQNNAFNKYRVISLFVDAENFIWAGLYGEGMLRINPVNGKIKFVNKELRNGNILNITGKGKTVWLATLGGATRVDFDNDNLVFKNFTTADGLSSDYIYQIYIDSKNRIWFATDGRGVDMMDEKGFHHYENGLASKVIFGLIEDLNHEIWVNAQGDGLYKLEFETFVIPTFKLRDNNIACLTTDRFGNPVVVNDLGIDIYRIKTNSIISKGEEAGIKNRIANLNAITKDKNGYIYIGTDNGIMKYDGEVFNNIALPKPIIKGLKVLNKRYDLSQDLELKHDQNSIMIEYSGFWFQNPNSLNFRYKLDNYDLEWISSRDRNVTYSSLPPGTYTYRLMVSDTEDFAHAKEAVFTFMITPPFWKTKIFYFLSVVVLSGLVYGYIKIREKQLLQDKVTLEAKVQERTFEIQRQTEEIQAQNEEILAQAEEIQGINENLEMMVQQRTRELEKKNKALEEYAFINAHELRAPVASILGLINLLAHTESEEEAKAVTKRLKESAEKLNDVVRSITKAIERGDV
jgi:ligand-binding sensor domain-containing protein